MHFNGNNAPSLNLRKGEGISLRKDNKNLDKIHVGLGWNVNTHGDGDFDLDASVFMLGSHGRILNQNHFVFFNNLASPEGSVIHMGDNLIGGTSGDDEVIKVQLSKVPENIAKIVFTVTIYDAKVRRQNFGQVRNAFIRIEDEETGSELCKFDLSEDYSSATSIIVAELERVGNEWRFNAVGDGLPDEIDGVCRRFGINA